MYNRIHRFFRLTLVTLFAYGCADFVEYPLEDAHISLLAPHDSLVTTDTVIHFWWDSHQDARYYRLQIVSPRFDSIRSAIIDTLVVGDRASFALQPGRYSWRVRPENYGSVGKYTYQTFTINPSTHEE